MLQRLFLTVFLITPSWVYAKHYGKPFSGVPSTPLAEVLTKPQKHGGHPIFTEGFVRNVCSQKGCWLELAVSEKPKTPSCRVTFKDYGFFVPQNSAGKSAKVEGQVLLEQGSVRIVASGVQLSDP
jgi:hypothetical protein